MSGAWEMFMDEGETKRLGARSEPAMRPLPAPVDQAAAIVSEMLGLPLGRVRFVLLGMMGRRRESGTTRARRKA